MNVMNDVTGKFAHYITLNLNFLFSLHVPSDPRSQITLALTARPGYLEKKTHKVNLNK